MGNGIAGISAALEEAIARNEAGIRAQFAHAELTAKSHAKREIDKLEADIRRTTEQSAASASAAGAEAATPVVQGQATSTPQPGASAASGGPASAGTAPVLPATTSDGQFPPDPWKDAVERRRIAQEVGAEH